MQLVHGDCIAAMGDMSPASVDTVVTDPPYGLSFMGKEWDHGVPGEPFWREALRVAKPGAFLLAFGGTRTFHRLTCAIEDAGWEIRDCMMWLYGSGFPKSLNIGKGIDKVAGAERVLTRAGAVKRDGYGEDWDTGGSDTRPRYDRPATDAARKWDGWGTALKPAWEPIIVAMKPLDGTFADNAERHGVAGLNIDGARIGMVRWPANVILDEEAGAMLDEQSGELTSGDRLAGVRKGLGYHGGGGDGGPAIHGNSGGASRFFYCAKASKSERNAGLEGMEKRASGLHDDDNYRKPGERKANHTAPMPRANHHPTVKPAALMEYLCRLTATPDGGTVLDPFMGSGSTGVGAVQAGRDFIGIDMNPEYVEIAQRRIEHAEYLRREQSRQTDLPL